VKTAGVKTVEALTRDIMPPTSDSWDKRHGRLVEAVVVEELPSLLYRLELSNKSRVLAAGAGAAQRNWVRLLPGDRVEVEFAEHDLTRGRIVKKVG
jgi:translation initiation factor IF-1